MSDEQIPWGLSDIKPSGLITSKDMTPEQKEVAIRGNEAWIRLGLANRTKCSRCPRYYEEPSPNCVNVGQHALDPNACHVCGKSEVIEVRQVSDCHICELPVCTDCCEFDYGGGEDGNQISQWDCLPCLQLQRIASELAEGLEARDKAILSDIEKGSSKAIEEVLAGLDKNKAA